MNYQMFDQEGTDFQSLVPERGPVGSYQWATWATVNPERGKYNWSNIDARLRAVENMTVTLASGEVIPHPVIVTVMCYLSSAYGWSSAEFYDATPQWVYREMGDRPEVGGRLVGHKLTGCGYVAVMPAWDSYVWRSAWLDFVKAFGEHYANDPRVSGIVISTGLDGETQPIKNYHCQWETIIDEQAPGTNYRFSQLWRDTMLAYRNAFPNTQLWIDNVAGGSGTRKASSDYAATLNIGLQNSALTTDIDSHTGYGGWTGQWDMERTYSQTLNMNFETRLGYGSKETMYWTYLAGLHYHPDVITVHPDYLTVLDPATLGWVNSHIGVTLEDTPSVWIAFRDYEYPKVSWGSNNQEGASGAMDDWSFWITRIKGGIRTFALPEHEMYSRQARTTDDTIVLNIDDGFVRPNYEACLVYVDSGTDYIRVDWSTGWALRQKHNSGEWVTWNFPLHAYEPSYDIVIDSTKDGIEIVHMLEVIGLWTVYTPTLSPVPSATIPPIPTRTKTVTATISPSPQPTTITPTATRTGTPVYGALSAICDQCQLIYDGETWLIPLSQIGEGVELVPVNNKLWACSPSCEWSEIVK
jgi:hypothetical protein